MTEINRRCELCSHDSTVYCPSDSAFLCTTCDEKVHRANFLVARHVRVRVCSHCRNLAGKSFSGVGVTSPGTAKVTCESCSPHVDDDDCLSSSSSCVSSTCSSVSSNRKRKNVGEMAADMKVEGILVNWCRRLGVDSNRVVKMGVELLNGCVGKMTVLPFRVLIATVFWVAVRVCCGGGREVARVEQISGVPSKLILATGSRLVRVFKHARSREDHVEGWAEC